MKAIKIFHVNTGSCNGCDIEALSLVLKKVVFVTSIEDADCVLFTGPLSKQIIHQVTELTDQAKEKNLPTIVVGSCALSGGIWCDSKAVDPIVVNQAGIYVYGCPPHPKTILKGVKLGLKEG